MESSDLPKPSPSLRPGCGGKTCSARATAGLRSIQEMDFKPFITRWIARWTAVTRHPRFRVAAGAMAVAACGLFVWRLPVGEAWAETSYDYLFRFSSRSVTNRVAIIRLDNDAYANLGQRRDQRWDRALHARLINKLKDDGCALVVMDIFFREAGSNVADAALAAALKRPGKVVLMAEAIEVTHPDLVGARVNQPAAAFVESAASGIGKADANTGEIVRRHWPHPAPVTGFPSLAWTAAVLAGSNLPEEPVKQWLRYYPEGEAWKSFSYHHTLELPRGHFTNTVVFIGSWPEHENDPGVKEDDKFLTPLSHRDGRAVGGVEVVATTFLNLMNRDWLLRTPDWVEACGLLGIGLLLGGLAGSGRRAGLWLPVFTGLAAFVGAVLLSLHGDYWFPWLIVVGAQVPCALAVSLVPALSLKPRSTLGPTGTVLNASPGSTPPPADFTDAPGYDLVLPAFGEGAFGKVWLVRNAVGQWQALKAVYQAKFGENTKPYEAEFRGIQKYKPISNKHLGLLTVDFVSAQQPDGYFYYVMELGDSRVPGWETKPETYAPLDLKEACARHEKNRLPVRDCLRIVIQLADALAFLHDQGLTHRDIKPSNIIFVNGQPKLADVGLVTPARSPNEVTSYAGTPGYMPPPPEPTGTKQADLYALGMVLYVISTGRPPAYFPELKTSLVMDASNAEFMFLNPVIITACQADLNERYGSAAELKRALEKVAGRLPS